MARWSREVRDRDEHQCVACGATKFLNAHHILPKERYPEFQFAVDNGITLCVKHHKWGKTAAHTNPVWFVEFLKKHRPGLWRVAKWRIA